jgi:hypothetical protein
LFGFISDCGIPNPGNAQATLTENKTTYGETAVVSCYDGYQPGGSYLVSCLANGTWETWPECTSVGNYISKGSKKNLFGH